MEVKKTVKYDGKIKGAMIENGVLIDEHMEPIDLVSILSQIYGNTPFDIATTAKNEDSWVVDSPTTEVSIDELSDADTE